jgi:hypothetical protein
MFWSIMILVEERKHLDRRDLTGSQYIAADRHNTNKADGGITGRLCLLSWNDGDLEWQKFSLIEYEH